MRPRSLMLAAGVVLAAACLPARLAQAQGDDQGPTVRDHRDRDRDRPPIRPRVTQVSPNAGDVGSMVTIRGQFPPDTRVVFGGVEIPVSRADRRSLTFRVPRVPPGQHPISVKVGDESVIGGVFRVEGRDDAPPPQGDRDRYKARWDRGGWTKLGEQEVLGRRDRDVINVGRREGRFTKLMIVVEESDLQMNSMHIEFTNGDKLEPNLKHFFRENERTRGIDLPGDGRTIKQIEFQYGNLPGGGRARVEVWGREDGDGRPGGHGPGGGGHPGVKPIVTDFWPREGAVGTEVTITGRRFTPQTEILFGNDVVRVTRRDHNLLTFVVPRARGGELISLRGTGWREVPVGVFQVSNRNAERERERWREERQREAERWWAERQRQVARDAAARERALREEEARLEREREQRRRERRERLRSRWEQRLLAQADVRAELALHAERSARLERMSRLAEAGDYGSLVVRVRLLMEYEDARHQQRMDDLKAAFARR